MVGCRRSNGCFAVIYSRFHWRAGDIERDFPGNGVSMAEKIRENRLITLLLLTGAVYFFLKFIAPLTAPVLTAMLFVTIFGPLLLKMQKKLKIHRQIGAILLLLLACGFLAVLL